MASKDERFKAIASDPRFNLPKKKAVKSKIDKRFTDVLEGDDFKSTVKIDKYGRKVGKKSAKEKLKRFYDFDEEKDEKDDQESKSDDGEDSDSESSSDSDDSTAGDKKKSVLDRMRGGASDDSESSSEEDSDEDSEEEEVENQVDEYDLGRSQVPTGEESTRLAVVNLDWDNIRAVDLMVTFNSFVPKGHRIKSVSIYPSEFGKQRMSEEDIQGPALISKKKDSDLPAGNTSSKAQENDKDQDYSSNALRKYQLQRLQYYYAVVSCDSIAAASSIYDNCDGTEYEATANIFDLRYVPDDVEFTDKPTDECTNVPLNYQPQEFITAALQHSKAKLTWDETPKERLQMAAKAFSKAEEEDMDIQAYLASDSDSEPEKGAADKYRALLAGSEKPAANITPMDMEITFNSALEGNKASLEIGNSGKEDPLENMSTIERYRLKEKERRQKRMERAKARKAAEEAEQEEEDTDKKRAELELMLMDDMKAEEDDNKAEEDASKKKKKYKQTKTRQKKEAIADAESDFNTADPRFQALFEDPDYAIDSTNPQFKKTKAMEKVLDERRRRTPKEKSGNPNPKKSSKAGRKEESVKDLVESLRNKRIKTKH